MSRYNDWEPPWFKKMQDEADEFFEDQERQEAFKAFMEAGRVKDGDKPKPRVELTDKELAEALWTPYSGIILDATPEMLNSNATAKAKKYLMRVEKPMIESGWVESKEMGAEGRIKKFVFMIPGRFSAVNQAGEYIPKTAYLLGEINRHCKEVFAFLDEIAKSWDINIANTVRTDGRFYDMNIMFRSQQTVHALRDPLVRSEVTATEPGEFDVDFTEGSVVLEAQFSKGKLFFKPLGFIDHPVGW